MRLQSCYPEQSEQSENVSEVTESGLKLNMQLILSQLSFRSQVRALLLSLSSNE